MKMSVRIGAAVAVVAAGMLPVYGGVQIQAPAVMDNALVSITVSDLHGMIDGLGTTAAQVSPMMTATTLKSLLGMQLGDPMLAGIAPGKGLAVVAMDPATSVAVIELSSAQAPAYTNTLATMGMQCRYTQGVLVAAKTGPALEKGVAVAGSVRRTLLARRTPTLRIGMQPAAYIAANDAMVQGMLQSMTATVNAGLQAQAQVQGQTAPTPQGAARILEGEMRVLISLLKQVEAMEIVVSAAGGALKMDQVVQPVPGSRLASLITAPKKNRWNPKVQTGAAGSAAFMIDFLIENTAALSAFMSAETEQLMSEMSLEADTVKQMSEYMQTCMAICNGSVSESILGGTSPGMNMDYVMDVTDEASALDLMKNMQGDLKKMGFLEFYEDMGMPMSFAFRENMRQYKGVDIHQFEVKLSMDDMPEIQRQQMAAMNLANMTYEVAILDGLMAYAMGDTSIESIIDRIKGPTPAASPLVARKVFPSGGFYYGDTDIGRYLEFVSGMMPDMPGNPVPFSTIAMTLRGAPPVTSAGHSSGGLVQWSLNVPAGLLARIGQAAMAIQMQQMQQQMGTSAPAGAYPQAR